MKRTRITIIAVLLGGCFADVPVSGPGKGDDTDTDGGGSSSGDSTTGSETTGSPVVTTGADTGSTSAGSTGMVGSTDGGSSSGPGSSSGSTGEPPGSTSGSSSGPGSTGSTGPIEPTRGPLEPCDVDGECLSGDCYLPAGLPGDPQGFCLEACVQFGDDCPMPAPGTGVTCKDVTAMGSTSCYQTCSQPGVMGLDALCPVGWMCHDLGAEATNFVCFPA